MIDCIFGKEPVHVHREKPRKILSAVQAEKTGSSWKADLWPTEDENLDDLDLYLLELKANRDT